MTQYTLPFLKGWDQGTVRKYWTQQGKPHSSISDAQGLRWLCPFRFAAWNLLLSQALSILTQISYGSSTFNTLVSLHNPGLTL